MELIPEKEFIDSMLESLNDIESGWIYGDDEEKYRKIGSVDIVNHKLKIAIEIKDVKNINLPPAGNGAYNTNLKSVSKNFQRDIESANKKFRNYPKYQSVILIRHLSRATKHTLAYLIGGFYTLTEYGRIPNTEVNISRHSEECSVYAFLNPNWSDELVFYRNSKSCRESDIVVELLQKNFINFDEILEDDLWSKN
jgi:hypothetical protein